MDCTRGKPSDVTLTFEVGKATGLPPNLTTRIEITGAIGAHVSEPSSGAGPYAFNPPYVVLSRGPQLLDAVCNEKLTVKLVDVTLEAKEKNVCLGVVSMSLVPLLQERLKIEQQLVLALNTEACLSLNRNEECPRTVLLDVGVAVSDFLCFPEDFDDWNIFTVTVQGVYNLPSTVLTLGANGQQDSDSQALTYTIHLLGSRLAGGSLMVPRPHTDEKPTTLANNSKGNKADKPNSGNKSGVCDREGGISKETEQPTATPPEAGGGSRQQARASSSVAGAVPLRTGAAHAGVKQDDTASNVETCEEKRPFLMWEENQVHFYRGRRFLAQLMHAIDDLGGVWLYLIPKYKTLSTDDKGGKSNNKHSKPAASSKNKVGNKVDLQLAVETCRRLAGRAWVPLDALRKEGCLEISGSFVIQPLEAGPGGLEEDSSAGTDTPGGRKPENLSLEISVPPESFEEAQTHVKLSIHLRTPLLPLQPRDVPSLLKDVSTVCPASCSPTGVAVDQSSPATDSKVERLSEASSSHATTARTAYVPAHSSGCPSSLDVFKECVQQGVRWIARELSASFSPAQQHLLAAAIGLDRSSPLAAGTAAAGGVAATTDSVVRASSVRCDGNSAAGTESVAEGSQGASSDFSAAISSPLAKPRCVDAAARVAFMSQTKDDIGVNGGSCASAQALLANVLQSGGLSNAEPTASATEVLVKHLKQRGCYDSLYQKTTKAVCTVIRDQLRQDVALTAAAAAASPTGEATTDRRGEDTQGLQKRAPSRRLSTSTLQQRLDRFFSEVFVLLVDTLQSTVNSALNESQCMREHHRLRAPEPPLWESPEEAEAAVFGKSLAESDAACCSLRSQLHAEKEKDGMLARLSFEAEVVGNMPRSVYLHKCRLANPQRQRDPTLWLSLARLLLRTNESHVEQAEKALWKCIDAYGGAEKASTECLLMLGSCLLHRRRFNQARAAFVRALQSCTVSSCGSAPTDTHSNIQEEYEHQRDQHRKSEVKPDIFVHDAKAVERRSVDTSTEVAMSKSSASLSVSAHSAGYEALPYFFLCMCFYFAGDTRQFEKYLSLALKPAAYFQLDPPTQQEQEELRSVTEEETARENADERPSSALSALSTWPEKSFEELEQTLSTFPQDTFYSPMQVDYPALSLLLLLLKFGFSSLCFSVLALEDSLLHPDTRESRLLFLIKAKAYLLKSGGKSHYNLERFSESGARICPARACNPWRGVQRYLKEVDMVSLMEGVYLLLLLADYCSAAAALHRLLLTCPKHREALSLLAECYFRQGLVELAAKYYMRSLDFFQSPRDCVIYLRLGQLMLEKKDFDGACKYYKESLQFSSTCEAWLGLAAALYRMRRLREALEAATAANWLDRERGETWGYLVLIFLLSGSCKEAQACLKCGSSDSAGGPTSINASTGEANTVDNCTITEHNIGDATACQHSSADTSVASKGAALSKSSKPKAPSCRLTTCEDKESPRRGKEASASAASCSRGDASTRYTNEANTCTRYMLKNGVGGRFGIGRLGGMTSVCAKCLLSPNAITAEDNFAAINISTADNQSTTTLEWGGGLLVEVAHQHLEVRGACAAEIAEVVARQALENPFSGTAAARRVLAEALLLQGRYAAAFEELLKVMRLLIEEFALQQRERLRALGLVQQHSSALRARQKNLQQEQKQQEHGKVVGGYSFDTLSEQLAEQKALLRAKLADTQRKASEVAATLTEEEQAWLGDRTSQMLQRLEEITMESLLSESLEGSRLQSD